MKTLLGSLARDTVRSLSQEYAVRSLIASSEGLAALVGRDDATARERFEAARVDAERSRALSDVAGT
jgi:hypothetical protein